MKLSVIIPTHNRADILELCLNKITQQQGVDFEVIVVDDGSEDHTAKVVAGFKEVIYIKQKASHQGTARNKGAKKATGDILVFIGDDILAEPGFLMQHANIHTLNPGEEVVVLGYTAWDPFLEITPYMEFLESSGWQFAYFLLQPGFTDHPEPYKFFYTSNISLKKSLFDKEKFSTKFTEYGWEDIELGYRLWAKHGMRLYYEPDAVVLHHHTISESTLEKRMQTVGRSAVTFEKLQPDVQVIPRGAKAILLKFLAQPIILAFIRFFGGVNSYYKFKSWQQFLEGVKEATGKK
ncbi:glycosyltransferase [Patescibacteria group bacterium]|nr:glycosyltransferase [Patescibacteria group bacterium]MBU1015722.1 glycosyltransferase [Patescibacteria group bacterium]MBU1684894.1 glycosyltransferase [Patescibacteria group bacterium]MBU1938648.1 glycosyltransferase [Patescibacteria group bacterium]